MLRAHDRLDRLSRVWARNGPGETLTLRERVEYGDGGDPAQSPAERTAARARHALGRPVAVRDEAGLVEYSLYDFKANPLETTRRVLSDATVATG